MSYCLNYSVMNVMFECANVEIVYVIIFLNVIMFDLFFFVIFECDNVLIILNVINFLFEYNIVCIILL